MHGPSFFQRAREGKAFHTFGNAEAFNGEYLP